MLRLSSDSQTGTKQIAKALASVAKEGDVFGLIGDLGVGKTTFAQGFVAYFDSEETLYVNSPSYTIVNEYPTTPKILHYDFYRIEAIEELWEVGYNDAIRQGAIVLVEWFDIVESAPPDDVHRIVFSEKEAMRTISFQFSNEALEKAFIAALKRAD